MAKKSTYFDDFIEMIEYSCKAAELLQNSLKNFTPETLPADRLAMHEIENEEDKLRHGMMERLAKEFVTPIDREDIIQLAHNLDTITDKIEDVLIRLYMYNIQEIKPAALTFSDVIVECCHSLRNAMNEFSNFRKSSTLHKTFIEVNSMEEKGDAIYIDAVHNLFASNTDPVKTIAWSKLFDLLEDCCDACEHVADVMEIIVLKNS